jgi:signal transduction histidine kinase
MSEDLTQEKFKKSKEEFIKIASHKMLSPLSSIRWCTQILRKNKNLTEDDRNKIDEIDAQVNKMADFANLLLNISHAEGIKFLDEKIEVDFCRVVSLIEEELQEEITRKKLAVNKNIPDCKIHVNVAEKIVRELTRIIFENAVIYSNTDSEIEVSITVDGSTLSIQVGNYGSGIELEEKDLVFEPFFRGKNATKIYVNGEGVDLYLAKKYIDALGGDIFYESNPDDKTIFCVNIPLKD